MLIIIPLVGLAIGAFLISPFSERLKLKDSSEDVTVSATDYQEVELNIKNEYLYNSNSPRIGENDSLARIVIFSDYQCPFCADADEIINQLITKYGDKIQLTHRDFVVHPTATIHAKAAQAANLQGKFLEMNKELFSDANLDVENEDGVIRLAEKLSLDITKFRADLNSEAINTIIDQDKKDASNIGLTGTPSIFFNGEKASASGLEAKIKETLGE